MPFRFRRPVIALVSSALLATIIPNVVEAQVAPSITNYNAPPGSSTLVITGSGFGSTGNIVRIDNIPVTVEAWSNTSITVDLPSHEGPGSLSVVTAGGLTANAAFTGVERGYYLLSQTGSVTAMGGAVNYGDLPSTTATGATTSPAVQLIPTPDNAGYWILTRNGTIYAFGDATKFDSINTPITAVAMATLPSGLGAYVLAANGSVYPLGSAKNYGSPKSPIAATSLAVTPNGQGYWILGAHGMVYPYGNARRFATLAPSTQATIAHNSLVRVSGTAPVFWLHNGHLYHVPNLTMLQNLGYRISQVRNVPSLNGYTLNEPLVLPYPDGTVVEVGVHHYFVQHGVLHPISPTILANWGIPSDASVHVPSLKNHWPLGPAISSQVTMPPIHGSLFRVRGQDAVYIVNQGQLQRISTGAVFRSMGLAWNSIHLVDKLPDLSIGAAITAATPIFTDGTLWRQTGTHTVYLDQNGRLRQFPSLALFHALEFNMGEVRTISSLTSTNIGPVLGSTQVPTATTTPASNTASTSGLATSLIPTADGQGYWMLWQNGAIQSHGNAPALLQPTASQLGTATATSLTVTPDQSGYSLILSNGQVITAGDAQSITTTSSVVNVAMIAGPVASPGFLSFAYGEFLPHSGGSYQTLLTNPNALSAIIPTWYYLSQSPQTLTWTIGQPPAGSSTTVSQAHSEGLGVWPMFGSVSVGPFQNAARISATTRQIVQAVTNNGYDGVTIDFEPSQDNGLTLAQVSQQYTRFVAQLGAQLHRLGKSLMVDVYPYSYPKSPFNFQAIAPYVNEINIMSYGEFDSFTQAGPNQGLSWVRSIYNAALADGVPPAQIVMGMGPYGDYWAFNNSGIDKNIMLGNDSYVSDNAAATLLQDNPNIVPVWDPLAGSEIFMTNEYLNANGQWTVNPHASAVAPTQRLSMAANQSSFNPQVQNLQGLLNYILVRYAVQHAQSVPGYLSLNQNGRYGQTTANAVTQFQQDFSVTSAIPGVYDAATKRALQTVINQWKLGAYQYWMGSTKSLINEVQSVAVADHLGGISIWRAPFETEHYWSSLTNTVTISPAGN